MGHAYGLMWKTVSEDCNLACDYCYYSRVLGKPESVRRPTPAILEKVLREYLSTCGSVASIAWQGGEPLLAGLPFFQTVVDLEARLATPPQVLNNAVQTNGVLLNHAWAEFFREYRFLVGVSLDGPAAIHDSHRVTSRGHGSFARVMRGIRWLQESHVDYNILAVVGSHNVNHGSELLRFYRDAGFGWIQFIPQMSFNAQHPEQAGQYAITSDEYGRFLCETFDEWYRGGHPNMSVRFFDNVLQTYIGLTPDICTMQTRCPPHLIVESNGDLFPCDFYLDDTWRLGNSANMTLTEALATPIYARFAARKPTLPPKCQTCPWRTHCRGGCPRNRSEAADTTLGPDYFCTAYETFFAYADERLQSMARPLRSARTHSALRRL